MARPTLTGHPKFVRLAAAVGGKAVARGALELIWESAYASGDPFVGDADTLESIADWRGERGALARALHANGNGFLDLGGDGYYVHDLEDHAPDYVLKRWERERQRKEKGATIRSLRQAAARASWASRDANDHASVHANGEHLQSKCNADVSPPTRIDLSSSGSPSLVLEESGPDPDQTRGIPEAPYVAPRERRVDAFAASTSGEFSRVFAAYPRKEARARASVAFWELATSYPGGEKALADAILAAFPAMLKRHPYNGRNATRPFLETVLVERRWEDPESDPDDVTPAATGPPFGRQPSTATRSAFAAVLGDQDP